MVLAFA